MKTIFHPEAEEEFIAAVRQYSDILIVQLELQNEALQGLSPQGQKVRRTHP